jgi:integrase
VLFLKQVISENIRNGRKLKTPISVDIPELQNELEKNLYQNILEECISKMPRLAPFVIESPAMMELSKHVFIRNSGSHGVFEGTTRQIDNFCRWANRTPDDLVNHCRNSYGNPNLKAIGETERLIDDYAVYLQTVKVAPNTVVSAIRRIKCLFRSNYVKLQLYSHRPAMVIYESRSPTIDELRIIMNCANLRERLAVSILATSGIRIGTLCKLRYSHVKEDLEKNKVPVQMNIKAEITKGKTHNYCTFLNRESTEYLIAYMRCRRNGTDYGPAEEVNDESPLIKTREAKKVRPIPSPELQNVIHRLYFKAGVLIKKAGTERYEFNVHSLRKFFRTQMAFLGVDSKYVNYMMGHKSDRYFDAQLKGPEYLRHIYQKSGISIRQEDNLDAGKLAMIRDLIFKLGLNPEQVLNPNFNYLSIV